MTPRFVKHTNNLYEMQLNLGGVAGKDYIEWKRVRNRLILHRVNRDDTETLYEVNRLGDTHYAALTPYLDDHEPVRNVENWCAAVWKCEGTVLELRFDKDELPEEKHDRETVYLVHSLLRQYENAKDAKDALKHIEAINKIMASRERQ